MKKALLFLPIFIFIYTSQIQLFAQKANKQIEIKRTDIPPHIDGKLNDKVWQKATIAKEFYQYAPYNGKPSTMKTEVRILYDDEAIYVGAMMYDNHPDSIYKTLSKRDVDFDVDADLFVVQFSTFNDGINANMFMVTAAGVQTDIKGSSGNDDINWDAVWKSAVSITDSGWIAEMKIPYSALRISKDEEQVWGLNFFRKVNRKQEWSTWSWVNNEIQGFTNQSGEMTGIKGIKPPVRLSFTPYFSTFALLDSETDSWEKGIRGGLDLKYGINKSFTLDLMLIPDFSQVQSDDQILNLSAFETKYSEKRPFFTEGTELFSKGDIFYSKRIGSFPKKYWDVEDNLKPNEEIIVNPAENQIINATKITGRSPNGLGIGFFNAMTLKSIAKIKDTLTGDIHEIITQNFTNYNVLVFDQNLKNNSYVSLINTNYKENNTPYMANVTAAEFKLRNKKQSYFVSGKAGLSHICDENNIKETGYKYSIMLSKVGGNFRFDLEQRLADDKFNSNDLGFQLFNNYIENSFYFSYQMLQPWKNLLDLRVSFDANHQTLYNPYKYVDFGLGLNINATFKNYWYLGFFGGMNPLGMDDYYEARLDNQVYKIASNWHLGTFFGSDRRKKVSFRAFVLVWKAQSEYNQKTYRGRFGPTWRVNNKLRFSLSISPSVNYNDIGYVDNVNDSIIFGMRDRKTLSNEFITDFTFNNKMSLNLRIRHYWSTAVYKKYYKLNVNGSLNLNNQYTQNNNINFNAFNIDMVYTWRFAPGSDILLIWKNAIYDEGDKVINGYLENLTYTLNIGQTNRFAIKVLYYLDYNYLKKKKH